MRTPFNKLFGLGLGLALGVLCFACSEGTDDPEASGGSGGSDAAGSGGGDTGGTGGGSGGGDTGGTTTGGTTTTGGAGGEAGGGSGTPTEILLFEFATGDDGFELQDYDSPGQPPDPTKDPYANLYECCLTPNVAECAWTEPANTSPAWCAETTATQVTDVGFDGEPGMLKLEIPFTAYNQSVDVQSNFSTEQDWSGRIVTVRVKIESGFAPDINAPGGGYVSVKTGADWVYARGEWQNIAPPDFGDWIEFTIDMDSPAESLPGYDPSAVGAIGIQLSTGSGNNGTSTMTPADTVAYIDHVTYVMK